MCKIKVKQLFRKKTEKQKEIQIWEAKMKRKVSNCQRRLVRCQKLKPLD